MSTPGSGRRLTTLLLLLMLTLVLAIVSHKRRPPSPAALLPPLAPLRTPPAQPPPPGPAAPHKAPPLTRQEPLPPPGPEVDRVAEASHALRSQRFREVISLCAPLLHGPEESALAAHYLSGRAHMALHQHAEAIPHLRPLLQASPWQMKAAPLLAESLFRTQDLSGCLTHCTDPRFAHLPALQSWARRCREERASRETPAYRSGGLWVLHFDRSDQEQARVRVRNALQEAHRTVRGQMGLEPEHPVPVILYGQKTFHDITQAPLWSGGLYDGGIRIPVGDLQDGPELQRVITHEWTHAVLHQITAGRCPLWLHEGLAEHLSGVRTPRHSPIPLRALLGGFPTTPPAAIRAAYQTSHKAVSNLLRRWGRTSLKRLLLALGQGIPLEDAFRTIYPLTLATFLKQEEP